MLRTLAFDAEVVVETATEYRADRTRATLMPMVSAPHHLTHSRMVANGAYESNAHETTFEKQSKSMRELGRLSEDLLYRSPSGCLGVRIVMPFSYNPIKSSTITRSRCWSWSPVGSFGPGVIARTRMLETRYL